MEEVCKCTNVERKRASTSRKKRWNNVSKEELLAYFELVLLADSRKQWDVSTRDLPARWCSGWSVHFAVGRPGVHSPSRVIPKDFKNWHSQLSCLVLSIKKG